MTVQEAVQPRHPGWRGGRSWRGTCSAYMRQPVPIADVARRLIEDSRQVIPIEFTGFGPGEQLHEALLARDELDLTPFHELSYVPVPPLAPADVRRLDPLLGGSALEGLCSEAAPSEAEEPEMPSRGKMIVDALSSGHPRRRTSDAVGGH